MGIERYSVVRSLGTGGMSEVFEVEDTVLGCRRALKRFRYRGGSDKIRERFITEARLLARLDYPRIVKVFDFGVDAEGEPYFVMSLVTDREGKTRTLADLKPEELTEDAVASLYADLRDALEYIHSKGIVHRDLKLENVMIGPDGHAVLADFGISRISDGKDGVKVVDIASTIVAARTGGRCVMGSIGYLAPELELGISATPASDYYALGVIVYRLLTGEWYDAHVDLACMMETYDREWLEILRGLLHANPAARVCRSYEELCERARMQSEAEQEKTLASSERGRVRMRRIAVASAALSGLAVALVAVAFLSTDRVPGRIVPETPPLNDLFARPGGSDAADFDLARRDAIMLTYEALDRFRSGEKSFDDTVAAFTNIAAEVRAKDGDYFQDDIGHCDDEELLADMLDAAAEKMKGSR